MLCSPPFSINKRTSRANARSIPFFNSDSWITTPSCCLKKTYQKGMMVYFIWYTLVYHLKLPMPFHLFMLCPHTSEFGRTFHAKKLFQQGFTAFVLPAWDRNWRLLKSNLFILTNALHHCFLALLMATETLKWHFLSGPRGSLQNTCRF